MVAARRWAKHLKYAFLDGVDFFVLTRVFPADLNSSWAQDIDQFIDRVHRIEFSKLPPYFKRHLPKSFADKLRWKFSYWLHKLIGPSEQELIGDESIGSEHLFLSKATKLINEKNITHLILTVGPHRFSVILPELKKVFPKLKISIDYRDYWQDKEHGIKPDLLLKEREYERSVLASVDSIIVVNHEMKVFFEKLTEGKVTVAVLPHCYDPADFPHEKVQYPVNKDKTKLKFIYGGALYAKMENYLQLFARFSENLLKNNFQVETNLYLPFRSYENELGNIKGKLTIKSVVGAPEYFEHVAGSDVVLYFRPDWSPNAFSSKFFELIAMRKPILYFGPPSDVSEFLELNGLGIHMSNDNFETQFKSFIDLCEGKWKLNTDYDLSQHTFRTQNQTLYELIDFKPESVAG